MSTTGREPEHFCLFYGLKFKITKRLVHEALSMTVVFDYVDNNSLRIDELTTFGRTKKPFQIIRYKVAFSVKNVDQTRYISESVYTILMLVQSLQMNLHTSRYNSHFRGHTDFESEVSITVDSVVDICILCGKVHVSITRV